jgi:hypothetical protein
MGVPDEERIMGRSWIARCGGAGGAGGGEEGGAALPLKLWPVTRKWDIFVDDLRVRSA